MTPASLIGCGLALYAAAGLGVGVAFVIAGAPRVLPGAAALWPYVLLRWLRVRDRQ
jgi:hypothetical protein